MGEDRPGLSRRALLVSGTAGAAGLAVGAIGASAVAEPEVVRADGSQTVEFRGEHQAGVTLPPQSQATLVSLDLADGTDRDALRQLLARWTDDIERLMSGRPGTDDREPELAGRPARLTVTVGVGARVVEAAGRDVPAWLGPLPPFPVDRLQEQWTGGDVMLQVCGDDTVTVSHAVRLLTAQGRDIVTVRWVQSGFHGPVGEERLPRNLLGQVDGTINPAESDENTAVWIGSDSQERYGPQPAWLAGGSTMVVRRIATDLDAWSTQDRAARERAIGRRLSDGRPLTGGDLMDDADLEAVGDDGAEVIDEFAHVRLARAADPSVRFLRRPYNYDDPPAPGEVSNAGLIFVTFQADVDQQFVPVQMRVAQRDRLNEFTTPIGSAVFAVLPGAESGDVLGQALLGLGG